MRLPVAALLWCLIPANSPARVAAEQTFPYKAYVSAGDVYVRSGPGENYYPTEKLKAGQEVEVYRHDPGGWYAIRPPEGSFSWVSGRHLQLGSDNLASVAEDRVAARVGSRFSDIREVIQVRLNRGEAVEVLDARRSGPASTTSANTWYKIAPPSGEFRWVAARFVDPQFPRDGVRKSQPADSAPAEPAKTGADRRGRPRSSWTRAGVTARPVAESNARVTAQMPSESAPPAQPSLEKNAEPANLGPSIPRRITAEQFQAALNEIDVELSAMIVEEPSVWELGELKQRSQSLLNQAETALERGRSRALVSKIARFEDIKQRASTVSNLRQEIDRSNQQLVRVSPRPHGAKPAEPDDRYDAVGRLTPVVSPKLGAPQFALVDDSGNVRCYVSPAPGVNLRHYLGKEVGITGTRGYMPEQRANHLMAKHVSLVEGTTLR